MPFNIRSVTGDKNHVRGTTLVVTGKLNKTVYSISNVLGVKPKSYYRALMLCCPTLSFD